MKHILFLFLILPTIGLTQVLLSETQFQLGEIDQLNEDVVDLNIVNQSSEAIFILRIESENHVDVKYTSKTLKPNTAELIRIKLNPQKTGKTKEAVKLYFSSNQDPTYVEISADVKIIPKDNRQACPIFGAGERPQANFQQFVNQQKAGEISSFFVELIPSEKFDDWEMANKTEPIAEVVEIEEKPMDVAPEGDENENSIVETPPRSPGIMETLFGSPKDSVSLTDDSTKDTATSQEETQTINTNLLDQTYRPNNIVFLIDASTSMREEERMDILKIAMIQLLESLREIDYLSIVTYSGEAKVLLAPTSGISKNEIRQSIENIIADGSTQAVKGIKKAIQTGRGNFIEGGNNQIILATDGAFNIGERNMSLRKKIQSEAKEGLTITVLGIKNDRWTNKSLNEISDLGNGNLIKINSNRDAEKVLEEIKRKSKF